MKRLKTTACAMALTITLSSSAIAGNIGGMRTNAAGNIGGMRTNAAGNIGGMRTNAAGNIGGMRTNWANGTYRGAEELSTNFTNLIRLILESAGIF